MALFGGLFGGDEPPTPPTQTVTRNASPEELRIRQLAMPGIEKFATQQLTAPEKTVAGFDPTQTRAQEMALGAAPAQQQLATGAANRTNFLTSGDIWNPSINPQIQGAIDASVRPVYENLTRSVLPNIRGEAINTGGFGGSRQGISEGMAIGTANQTAGDIASRIPTDLYKTNMQAQLSALGLVPSVQQAQLAPSISTGAVGDVRQGMSQAELDAMNQRDQFNQYSDIMRSRELMGLASGIPAAGTTATGSIAPGPSKGMQSLGGALAGAQLGTALMPGIGTGLGAVGGALLPFAFS